MAVWRRGAKAAVAVFAAVFALCAAVLAPAHAAALEAPEPHPVELTTEGGARVDGATFGVNGFERLAKGTARVADGMPEGYRLPISDAASLVVVSTPDEVLVHVGPCRGGGAGC